jgi:hypothetical protein
MCFFNSAEQACLEQRDPIYTLQTVTCRKYSFQKLIQYAQEINVLDAPASNTDGFLLRDACVSSTELNSPIWNQMSLSPP